MLQTVLARDLELEVPARVSPLSDRSESSDFEQVALCNVLHTDWMKVLHSHDFQFLFNY